MRIWRLTPTNLTDPIWKKWSPDPIIVRAENEAQARHLAVCITNKSFPPLPPMLMPVSPWAGYKKKGDPAPRPTLCEDITEQTHQYSVDGPAEVLRHGEKF
jgi:hypothetical protein